MVESFRDLLGIFLGILRVFFVVVFFYRWEGRIGEVVNGLIRWELISRFVNVFEVRLEVCVVFDVVKFLVLK